MQIESFGPEVPIQVELDGYLLVIRVMGNASWPPNYWRTGDFKYSLVEIAVDPTTGSICEIVVVAIREVSIDCQPIMDLGTQHRSGVPNASHTAWERNQTRVDVEGKVRGSLTGRTVTVFLDDSQAPFNLVTCGRVTFLLNSRKKLCGFQVLDLSDQEIENFLFSIGGAAPATVSELDKGYPALDKETEEPLKKLQKSGHVDVDMRDEDKIDDDLAETFIHGTRKISFMQAFFIHLFLSFFVPFFFGFIDQLQISAAAFMLLRPLFSLLFAAKLEWASTLAFILCLDGFLYAWLIVQVNNSLRKR